MRWTVHTVVYLVLGACLVACRNKAILINCSWQYENYRHFSNVRALQSILQGHGYAAEDIAVFMKQDLLADKRNTMEKLCIGDSLLEEGKDYTPKRRSSSYFDILNLISGDDPVMLGADGTTNLLIYLTGHGGDGFIKYCNRKYYYTDDLTDALIRLQAVRPLNKVFFISDTCQADTLIDASRLPPNVSVLSTSLKGESSHSANFNNDLNIYPIDLFAMSMYKLAQKGSNLLLSDLPKVLPPSTLLSTLSLHGPDAHLNDFLHSPPH
ncbi:phosphatidylinositol glycan, class K [Nematocida displodere]|uniref:Phosphatidylinositol glycan, class K n=1 Tax=Nematocida displodere TaxID=1805483 RepID=A0A177ECI7_9MICR|nr:phosphatidylinositol glycan, class K [Nematocida displodere]